MNQTKRPKPIMRRLQLGERLRVLRETAGLEAHQAGYKLRCVPGKIYHMENGRSLVRHAELEVLLTLYGATDQMEELEKIRAESHMKGWWADYKLPSWLARYTGLEDAAVRMRQLTNGPIPGILQTERYARAVNKATSTSDIEDDEQVIAARIQRGTRLFEGDIEFNAILNQETLLRTSYIPGGVGIEQLQKLLSTMELPNVTIRMLPFSVGPYPSIDGPFILLEFPEDTLDPVAYEVRSRIESVLDKEITGELDECYTAVLKLTLDSDATAEEIEALITDAKEIYPP